METTEFARPTTIPTLTCPRFGIGRLEHLLEMLLPLLIMPLPLAPAISFSFLIQVDKRTLVFTRIIGIATGFDHLTVLTLSWCGLFLLLHCWA
ncbi:hypothetical protein CR513_19855, partial [Mucuna pruriens]